MPVKNEGINLVQNEILFSNFILTISTKIKPILWVFEMSTKNEAWPEVIINYRDFRSASSNRSGWALTCKMHLPNMCYKLRQAARRNGSIASSLTPCRLLGIVEN